MDAVPSTSRSPDGGRRQHNEEADDLLRRTAGGDEQAFARLYDLVAPSVYGVTKRIVRNSAHAEEVAQEVLVDVWRTAARFDHNQGSAFTWVLTLAHRRAVDRVRSEESHRRRVDRMRSVSGGAGEEVDERVLGDLDRSRVTRALGGLTSAQRESIELAFFGGNTHAEISTLLGLPLGTVKTRIRDGLIRLRDALGEGE